MDFKRLFEPGKIGNLELKNRLVMAPMSTCTAANADVTDLMVNYYVARARGGVGLIVVEGVYPYISAQNRPWLGDDRCVPGLRRLVDAIHAAGAKAAVQLTPGRGTIDPVRPISPSGIPYHDPMNPRVGRNPKAPTTDEVAGLVAESAAMAWRARDAGFDAVQFHGAHGFLIAEFLSPLTNQRTDKYGGSIENRARFATELVAAAKARAGADFPVIFRLMADEQCPGGLTIKDTVIMAPLLEKARADAIDVTSGSRKGSSIYMIAPMSVPRGYNTSFAAAIRKTVHIPVMVAGRIDNPAMAEAILKQGQADFISLARCLIADADFPIKAAAGRAVDITPCIACLHCVASGPYLHTAIRCSVNPTAGREGEYDMAPAKEVKKVLVIGGGPAGMQAALIAAERGHEVTLCEKTRDLGGQLLLAEVPPHKDEIANFTGYLVRQIFDSDVEVKLGAEVNAQFIEDLKPDVAIVATGAVPAVPDIPGVTGPNVVIALQVLSGGKETANEVAVIGGGTIGCEVAELLRQEGKTVTVLEMLDSVAQDVILPYLRTHLLDRLTNAGINLQTKTRAVSITAEGVHSTREGQPGFFPAGTIVLATGMKSDNRLVAELQGKVPGVIPIGDCAAPNRIAQAIEAGFRAGLEV